MQLMRLILRGKKKKSILGTIDVLQFFLPDFVEQIPPTLKRPVTEHSSK